MSFGNNLKIIRAEKNLSQEQLAELLGVSRQAVSRWEQDSGYPETERVIQIAQKLDVSLDSLLLDKKLIDEASSTNRPSGVVCPTGQKIMITTHDGKLSSYYKFQIMKGAFAFLSRGRPNHWLVGTDRTNFLGEDAGDLLGLYMTKEDAEREMRDIKEAIQNGERSYQLKYNVSKDDFK